MAGTSLLALLDDIASVLDDIALMTKVAAKKTAGVLGDDLALNAEQVSGVRADRELPVVWAVAKGSLRNKAILVPLALLLSAIAPWAVTPLLMLGGAYLCFEGCEKVAHHLHSRAKNPASPRVAEQLSAEPSIDLAAYEKKKIKGAIRTDFILSAEITIIALGTVQGAPLFNQIMVVTGIAVAMTFGVYALVAGIVKLDDLGLLLTAHETPDNTTTIRQTIGRVILRLAPYLMKALSIIGTIAMFMVGGGILLHGLPVAHTVTELIHQAPQLLIPLLSVSSNIITGLLAGAVGLNIVNLAKRLTMKSSGQNRGA